MIDSDSPHRFGEPESEFDEEIAGEDAQLIGRLNRQFHRLQLKAMQLGIQSIVVLHAYDPMNGYTFRRMKRVGDHFSNLGALQISCDQLRDELAGEDGE